MNSFANAMPERGTVIIVHKEDDEHSDTVVAFYAGNYVIDDNTYSVISKDEYPYWETLDSFLYRVLKDVNNKDKEIIYKMIEKIK